MNGLEQVVLGFLGKVYWCCNDNVSLLVDVVLETSFLIMDSVGFSTLYT